MEDNPDNLKLKADLRPPQPSKHFDPRMHLTLFDMMKPFGDVPKIAHPLVRSAS